MIIQKIISDQAPMAKQNQAERSLSVGGAMRKSHLTQTLCYSHFLLILSAEVRSQQSSWILEKPDERCRSKPTNREVTPERGREVIVLTCK